DMNQQPDNALEARKEARRRRRRRRQIMQIFIILAVVLLLALVGTLVVLHIVGNQAAKNRPKLEGKRFKSGGYGKRP
ncbi:MAG: hypothetical protein IKC60_00820, partial [Clostridia bacterium]|nr:hypothetical protein [Clostridia bacterium]